ncbi:VWA domain-containing protein [Leucobacter luti]|uniref:vWA domain-containing protein n=1 Tax=Leucobacter luti TaxID=340320 RepID=UPI003D0691BC
MSFTPPELPQAPRPLGAPLAEQLRAVGALAGIPVLVDDGEDWRITDGALVVGLSWYAIRGHSEREASALALLQLWEGPRAGRLAPVRERRAAAIRAARPEIAPLVSVISRLAARAELLAAMPGLHADLCAALARSTSASLADQPRHLQFLGALLRGIGAELPAVGLDPAVAAEVRALATGGGTIDPVRRALAPDPDRDPLLRFGRALALLLPPTERLLALDLRDRGLEGAGGDGSERAEGEDPFAAEGPDPAAGAGGGSDAEEAGGEGSSAEDESPAENDSERARKGEGRQLAEGADLFAAEQAGFVSEMLETPMPAGGALLEAALELPAKSRAERASAERPAEGSSGGAGSLAAATALASYRGRVAALAEPIERMREVWGRVIAERIAPRPRLSRRPGPEGEELDPESLTSAVAQSLAGVRRPAAYRHRVALPRRSRRAGSTDYVLVVDRSASMQGPPSAAAADAMLVLGESLAAVMRDVEHAELSSGVGLELELRTALIVYDAEAHLVKPLSSALDDGTRRRLHAATRSPRGASNDAAALALAGQTLGVRGSGGSGSGAGADSAAIERKRIVILVSDGGSNDPAAAARELSRLRAAGVRVFGIGIGANDLVERFAPSAQRVDDPRALPAAVLSLVEREVPGVR